MNQAILEKWKDVMTPRDVREQMLLETFQEGVVIPLEDIRLVANKPVCEGDDATQAVMVDKKGYLISDKPKKEKMPFFPPSTEFQEIYKMGFRLAHMSFPTSEGTLVVHYWVNPTSGLVKTAKIKRD